MSLISLYREFLQDEEKLADYFLMDSQYLANIAHFNDFYLGDFEQEAMDQARQIRNGKEPENFEYFQRMMGAEAKWSSATFMWKRTPFRYILNIGPKLMERKVKKGKQLIADREVSKSIEYSHPSEFSSVEARDGFGEGSSFGEATLHLDWLEYVAEPSQIKLDSNLIGKTKKETFDYYFNEGEEMSERVRNLQLSLWANDVAWIENLHKYYSNSNFFKNIADNMKKGVENDFDVKLDNYKSQNDEILLQRVF